MGTGLGLVQLQVCESDAGLAALGVHLGDI